VSRRARVGRRAGPGAHVCSRRAGKGGRAGTCVRYTHTHTHSHTRARGVCVCAGTQPHTACVRVCVCVVCVCVPACAITAVGIKGRASLHSPCPTLRCCLRGQAWRAFVPTALPEAQSQSKQPRRCSLPRPASAPIRPPLPRLSSSTPTQATSIACSQTPPSPPRPWPPCPAPPAPPAAAPRPGRRGRTWRG
jgi:hypothetical protein